MVSASGHLSINKHFVLEGMKLLVGGVFFGGNWTRNTEQQKLAHFSPCPPWLLLATFGPCQPWLKKKKKKADCIPVGKAWSWLASSLGAQCKGEATVDTLPHAPWTECRLGTLLEPTLRSEMWKEGSWPRSRCECFLHKVSSPFWCLVCSPGQDLPCLCVLGVWCAAWLMKDGRKGRQT